MRKNLNTKTIVIVLTILVCIYGIIGIPKSTADLKGHLAENIKLGLDLRGGTRLVLQVQVQDAAKAEAQQTIDRLKDDLRKANIDFASMESNDPATPEQADSVQITVKGIPTDKSTAFRNLVADHYPTWILTATGTTEYRMTIRPTDMLALKSDTVKRTQQTIENRINALGLTEPVVQIEGRPDTDYRIVVQLPSVDDPARVREIIGTAAVLEIGEVKDGPFASEDEARAKHG